MTAGVANTGNVTIVFRSLGFRTTDGASKYPCSHYKEASIADACVKIDPDINTSALVTGVRNADAIERAITGLASFLVGLLVHK